MQASLLAVLGTFVLAAPAFAQAPPAPPPPPSESVKKYGLEELLGETTPQQDPGTLQGQVIDETFKAAQQEAPAILGDWVLEGREPNGTRYRGAATMTQEGGVTYLNFRLSGGRTRARAREVFHDHTTGATTYVVETTTSGTPGVAGVLQHLGETAPPAQDVTSRHQVTLSPSKKGNYFEMELVEDGRVVARERLITPVDLAQELHDRYGARPRSYGGFFNDSNEAERVMVATLRQATADLNAKLAARGQKARVDMAMLATNFISEGGYYPLDQDQLTGVSGFGHLGVDTIIDNYKSVKPWLPESVRPAIEDPANHYRTTNELRQEVTTVSSLSLEQGIHANAAMFVMYTAQLERDLAQRGMDISQLDPRVQFFWNTVYFNAGPGTGRAMMDQQGVASARKKYTGPETNKSARFNATWRTGSYELLSRRVLLDDDAAWTRLRHDR